MRLLIVSQTLLRMVSLSQEYVQLVAKVLAGT